MNIVLPEKFYFKGASRENFARVEDGNLVIRGTVPFKKMMYDLAYKISGTTKCFYCGKTISKGKLTLDHMYPLDLGGPTIPDNMVPACSKCNSEKSNMTCAQYKEFHLIRDHKERRILKRNVNEYHETMRRKRIYELPKNWVTDIALSTVIVELFFKEKFKGTKYNNIKRFYENYGFLQKPIIVNKNHYLFNGFTEIVFAREIGLQKVPAIVLDNVKVIL